jgi:glycosyltransferase involved in cell wall biosynthesis
MIIAILLALGLLSGFILFQKNTISDVPHSTERTERLSIIIPARNEEKNLPNILSSLQEQTFSPCEIIVVNDHSVDKTKEIAESFGVKVFDNPTLPKGWTGKTWAVWNGYLQSTGDVIAFFDADVELAPNALRALVNLRNKKGGVLSVVPFHKTERFYERFALITNILGAFAFTSPFEEKNKKKGLYGSCIITTRNDYEKINGHHSIKSELLDDLTLGAKYIKSGINVNNFIGDKLVSFRMYPHGLKSELEGFAKGAILSTNSLDIRTLLLIILWIAGLIVSETFFFFMNSPLLFPLFAGYLLYVLQIFYLVKHIGNFGKLMPIFHFLSTLFFFIVLLYSIYQVVFLKHVAWKGRNIKVGRNKSS